MLLTSWVTSWKPVPNENRSPFTACVPSSCQFPSYYQLDSNGPTCSVGGQAGLLAGSSSGEDYSAHPVPPITSFIAHFCLSGSLSLTLLGKYCGDFVGVPWRSPCIPGHHLLLIHIVLKIHSRAQQKVTHGWLHTHSWWDLGTVCTSSFHVQMCANQRKNVLDKDTGCNWWAHWVQCGYILSLPQT